MARYDGYFDRGFWRGFGGPGRPRRYGNDFRPGYDRDLGPQPGGGRYDRSFSRGGGGYGYRAVPPRYEREFQRGPSRGYDEFARQPFMPEDAYRRHPEYGRPPLHRSGPWPAAGHDLVEDSDLTDEEILRAVHATMEEDSWIISDQIKVSVEDGVVTLSGEVGDYMEARYTWDDAWETEGVRGVINHLTVRTESRPA